MSTTEYDALMEPTDLLRSPENARRLITSLEAARSRDDPFTGIGKPEPLEHALAGAWSRRIDDAHRLVYLVDDDRVVILQARYHY